MQFYIILQFNIKFSILEMHAFLFVCIRIHKKSLDSSLQLADIKLKNQ
jgi:hypothetical protein